MSQPTYLNLPHLVLSAIRIIDLQLVLQLLLLLHKGICSTLLFIWLIEFGDQEGLSDFLYEPLLAV